MFCIGEIYEQKQVEQGLLIFDPVDFNAIINGQYCISY
jgi:hypothetical protein